MASLKQAIPSRAYMGPWIASICAVVVIASGGVRAGLFEGVRFEVSSSGLNIKGDPYGRVFLLTELQLGQAKIIELDKEPQYRPWLRTNGISLPSYRSGWHRLKKGERALVFLRPSNPVVYMPTSRGYALLLSPENPRELLAALAQPGGEIREFRLASRR